MQGPKQERVKNVNGQALHGSGVPMHIIVAASSSSFRGPMVDLFSSPLHCLCPFHSSLPDPLLPPLPSLPNHYHYLCLLHPLHDFHPFQCISRYGLCSCPVHASAHSTASTHHLWVWVLAVKVQCACLLWQNVINMAIWTACSQGFGVWFAKMGALWLPRWGLEPCARGTLYPQPVKFSGVNLRTKCSLACLPQPCCVEVRHGAPRSRIGPSDGEIRTENTEPY